MSSRIGYLLAFLFLFQVSMAQKISGVAFGYGLMTIDQDGISGWINDYNRASNVSEEMELPEIAGGINFGYSNHLKNWDYSIRVLSLVANQSVVQKDFGQDVSHDYRFKHTLYQFFQVTFYPANKYIGIGSGLDVGRFKVASKRSDDPITKYEKFDVANYFGQQFHVKLRVPLNKVAFSLEAFYQTAYSSAKIKLPITKGEFSYNPSGYGARLEIVVDIK